MTSPTPEPPMSRDSEMETRLAAIEARVQTATDGPWTWHWRKADADTPGSIVSGAASGRAYAVAMCPRYGKVMFAQDAEFIAHAREDVPWLIGRVRELESRLSGAPGAGDGARDTERLDWLAANYRNVSHGTLIPGARPMWFARTADALGALTEQSLCDSLREAIDAAMSAAALSSEEQP